MHIFEGRFLCNTWNKLKIYQHWNNCKLKNKFQYIHNTECSKNWNNIFNTMHNSYKQYWGKTLDTEDYIHYVTYTDLKSAKLVKGEGNGTPPQYSCLENPMDGGAWWAAVHGVTKSRTRLSDFTFIFTFMHWRRKWQPTPVFLPGESQGWGSLVGCHLWGHTESNMTEVT